MADPLLSVNEYPTTGSQTNFEVNFTGGYISKEHVAVRFFDEDDVASEPVFTWVGDFTISIIPAPAAGGRLRIYRTTPANLPLVDFSDGSVINEQTLDLNAKQAVFLAAEVRDVVSTAPALDDILSAGAVALAAQEAAEEARDAALAAAAAVDGAIDAAFDELAESGGVDMVGVGDTTLRAILPNLTPAQYGIPDGGDPEANVDALFAIMVAAANATGQTIKLGPRKYRVAPFALTTSLDGAGADVTILQSTVTTAGEHFVTVSGRGTTISNVTIDGNVSADPSPWNSGNYDSFTGSKGLRIVGSEIEAKNVRVQNVRWAGILVDIGSTKVLLNNCSTNRTRGNFGDGFIVMGASQVCGINCSAEDFTRIGFVTDTYGSSPGTYCAHIAWINCKANNGHDGSVAYGGGEYNSGFWSEKSGSVRFISCHSSASARGFVMASGEAINGASVAVYSAVGCTTDATDAGFVIDALGTISIHAQLDNCAVTGLVTTAYSIGGIARDKITLNDCSANLSGTSDARSSVKAGPGNLFINRFKETWTVLNATHRDDPTKYYASLGHFANAAGKIVVNGWTTYDSAGTKTYSMFKFLAEAAASLDLEVTDARLRGLAITGLRLHTKKVVWERLGSMDCADIIIDGGAVYETASIYSIVVRLTTERIIFRGVRFDFVTSGNWVNLFNVSNTNPWAKVSFENCLIIKNFETGNKAVLLTPAGGPFDPLAGTLGANHLLANGCTFVNTGGATANPIFFIDSATDTGGRVHGQGNNKSSSLSAVVNAANSKLNADAQFTDWA